MKRLYALAENAKMKKALTALCAIGALGLISILFYYSGYNFICADDFSVGYQTHLAWVERENLLQGIIAVIASVIQRVSVIYLEWGGNYSSMIFTSLQPAIFNEELTFLNIYILLGSFIFANLYFFWRLFHKNFGFSKSTIIVVCSGIAVLSTQWLPSAVEGFYWFNGSFYNIVGYSMGLIFVANMYDIAHHANKSKLFHVITALLGIFVAGTSYTVMLFLMLLGGFFWLYIMAEKCAVKQRINYTIEYVIFVAFCMVNICAPGNSIRQGGFERMGMIPSVYNSLMIGRDMFLAEVNWRLVLLLVVLVPFLAEDIRRMKFQFRLPLCITLLSYLLFSAMLAPTICALHSIGPDRTKNLYYWAAVLLHVCNYIYWFGWAQKKLEALGKTGKWLDSERLYLNHICLCGVLAFLMLDAIDINEMTSFTAVESIMSGEAQIWKEEKQARQEILWNPEIKDVVLQPLSVQPKLLAMQDVDVDPEYWINITMAKWYQKNCIILDAEPEGE